MPIQTLLVDLAVRYGFQVLGAVLILVVGLLAARWVGQVTDQRLQKQRMEPPMRKLIVRALRIVVMLFALVVALDKFGFQIAPLVAGIGVAGIGIGFALQGVLSNVMAGLTIIFTKPFRVGEHIAVSGIHGDVATIELFSTTLINPDFSRIIVPNRKIVGEILHNFGTTRQLTLLVTVPHGADLGQVLGTSRDVVLQDPHVLKDPPPSIGIAGVTELGIKVSIQPWVPVPDIVAAEGDLYRALVERFRTLGIAPPAPLHEVRMVDGVTPPSIS